ncbi:MAG: hypothetical protein NXI13_16420 [Proteobacteria bacterium]|nr:hypothetical protein [Pseudomonadota bacterium]
MSLSDQVDAIGQINDAQNVATAMGVAGLPSVFSGMLGLTGKAAQMSVQDAMQAAGVNFGGDVGGDTGISGADVQAAADNASMGMAPGEAAAASLGFGTQGMAGAGIATGPSARGQGPSGSIGATNPTNVSQSEVDNNNGAGDAGGDGTVICTELRRQGLLPDHIWEADERYAKTVSANIRAGYLLWARPWVRVMRRSKLATNVTYWFAEPWSRHMAHKMGVLKKDSYFGTALMILGIPICYIASTVAKLTTVLLSNRRRRLNLTSLDVSD